MTDLSVAYIYGESLQITKKYAVRLVLTLFVFSLISGVASALVMPTDFWTDYVAAMQGDVRAAQRISDPALSQMALSYLVQSLLGIVLFTAFIAGPLGLVRGSGERPGLSWFKLPVMTYVKVLLYALFYGVVTVVGMAFVLIPGVYLALRLWQGFYYLVEHPEKGVMEAARWSWGATRGHVLELLGLIMVFILGMVALIIAFGIFAAISASVMAVSVAVGVTLLILSALVFIGAMLFIDAWYYLMATLTYTTLADALTPGVEQEPEAVTEFENEPES